MEHRASLKKLVLHVLQSQEYTDAVTACSRLESLTTSIPYMEQEDDWIQWYESLAPRLRSLTLDSWGSRVVHDPFGPFFTIDDAMDGAMDELLSKSPVTALHSLELEAGYDSASSLKGQLLLMMKSPELKRLSWSCQKPIARLAAVLEKTERSPHGLFCQELESHDSEP